MEFNIIKILSVPFNKFCPPGPFLVPASLSTRYDPDPYVVVGTKGTSLLLKRAEPEIMRNSSAVRKLPRDDNNGMGEHPHEADRGSDQVVQTTGGPTQVEHLAKIL